MTPLSLPRPPTRELKLPEKIRTPAKPNERPRLVLPLRPIERLPARPIPRGRELPCGAIAFATADQAWFWTLRALAARHGASQPTGTARASWTAASRPRVKIRRPCDPDDIIRALDLLLRRGEITLDHARTLRRWGERGIAPARVLAPDEEDVKLWNEAIERLDVLLRAKSIVAAVDEENIEITDIKP